MAKIADKSPPQTAEHQPVQECSGPHQFQKIDPYREHRLIKNVYKCQDCGVEIDSIEKSWYDAGLAHGRVS